jgi:hypothetical protein
MTASKLLVCSGATSGFSSSEGVGEESSRMRLFVGPEGMSNSPEDR